MVNENPNQTTPDYYSILNVSENASNDQIRQAYIKESLRWHPDRNTAPEATEKFQDIAQAYFVLSDKEKRTAYDASRKSSQSFSSQQVNPNELFASIFDDLLVPEVPNPVYFWQPIGATSGAVLGGIIGNIPGFFIGMYFGSKMGRIRDMKGVSVYEAFMKLSKDKKAQVLSQLAQKFLKTMI